MQYEHLISSQSDFFNTNKTKDLRFRIEKLKSLKLILRQYEDELCKAIYNDLGKSVYETYETEILIIHHEINLAIKKLKYWSKRKRVRTNLANFFARSYIISEPLGNVLVISAWNYPYQLSLVPAISAIAAGNTIILKPSELAPHTSKLLAYIINTNFAKDYFHVIEGGIKETTSLISLRFDKIFFTGNTKVGKIIYEAAAKHLTPVTLELGGKNPAFILKGCNIKMSAQRLVWAKFLNAGQTCVAPDYVLLDKNIEIEFIEAVKENINRYYRLNTAKSDNYTRIINEKHFDRLESLIQKNKIFIGGNTNREKLFISPTVMRNISFDDKIMQDEIFGPILPIINFTNLDTAISQVKKGNKPLSCYIYSKSKKDVNKILTEISFGGGCINDSLMQLTNKNLPFGGVGASGMGRYYGEEGFKNFSNYKSILHKSFLFEPKLKYSPYTKKKLNIIKRFL